jgi:hypothetical protein
MVLSVIPWKRRAFLHHPEKSVRVQNPPLLRPLPHDFQIETVELLPHLGAALFASLPEILARRGDARDDGRGICAAEHQFIRQASWVHRAGFRARRQRFQQKSPPSRTRIRRLIEPQLQFDID